ncbi:substrate-binding domain-containing protein [Mesorhizobium sp. ES1-6]|uniref:substrate-binding domain-containing protein n=1 Tax=Mesorhizobium sp. ES1-6 TaxID=2876626 RepID=UPI001CCD9591|nr:substrate-binding domain-containing protein [Mesorhizobium sp. ES1-6]MBZ9801105.1 substrate-binding domain-containing protein [Mesorhizobium sp. ES1-6]
MRKLLASAALIISMASAASAETIAVSMARFDDNFGTVIRNAMVAYAKSINGVTIQVEDAQGDVAKQLDQIKNFAANKVDAIIVQPQDTSATQAMTDAAAAAGVPLVYLNREPINIDTLPANQALVASNERDSGTLETKEVCRLFKKAGKTEASVYVIMGELSNQAAVQRTQDILDVIGGPDCGVKINIIDRQTSNWQREQAQNLMTNWLSTGTPFDGVIANNDESAIGAIQGIRASGADVKPYLIAGIDASQDGMQAMQAGDLDVTVFQDAAGQGKGAVDAALALAHGKKVERKVFVPFQLVTPDNLGEYLNKN